MRESKGFCGHYKKRRAEHIVLYGSNKLQPNPMYLINFEKKNSMDTLIRMKVDDLNESLIDFLRNSFKGRNIEVHILEEEPEMDETDFVLKDPVARKEIMESIEEVNKGVGLKKYNTVEELKQEFLNEPKP